MITLAPRSPLPDFVVPQHPTVPNHPAPLMGRWLAEGDPLWTAGPWKALLKVALASGWTVRSVAARGWAVDSRGGLGALTDSLSLRCWHEGVGEDGAPRTDRAVAVWDRATWPTLGRAKKGDADEPAGEGRRSTAGRTWLWHPPMTPPPVEVDGAGKSKDPLATPWKFGFATIWTVGSPMTLVDAKTVRAWIAQPR